MMCVLHKLLLSIGLCFIAGKIHLFFGGDMAWYVYSVGLMAQQFIISLVLFSMVSYKAIRAKWVAFFIFLLPVIEALLFITEANYWLAFAIGSIISLAGLAYITFKSHTVRSVQPEHGKLYMVSHYPDNAIGLIVSLLRYPLSGFGLYKDGQTFKYKASKFIEIGDVPDDMIFIETGIEPTPARMSYLNNKVGCAWSIKDNCLTIVGQVQNVQQ